MGTRPNTSIGLRLLLVDLVKVDSPDNHVLLGMLFAIYAPRKGFLQNFDEWKAFVSGFRNKPI
jgi:hypothetical protein